MVRIFCFVFALGSLSHGIVVVNGARGKDRRLAMRQPRSVVVVAAASGEQQKKHGHFYSRRLNLLMKDGQVVDHDHDGGKAEKQYPPLPPLPLDGDPPPEDDGTAGLAPSTAPPVTPRPVYFGQWGTGGAPTSAITASPTTQPITASPTQDDSLERICQAAMQGVPYPSSNHVVVNYMYDVQALESLSASAIPDSIAAILRRGYILRHCDGAGGKNNRALLLQAGDVQSVTAYPAELLLNTTTSCVEETNKNCDTTTTRWKGTNQVNFRDSYDITDETEATILQDIRTAFESMDLINKVQTADPSIQGLLFVTGSGATTAIVDESTGHGDDDSDSKRKEATSRNGMKPVGKAFLTIAILSIVAVLLYVVYVMMMKRREAQADKKSLSHVRLGTTNTMQNEDEYVDEDSDGFVPFRPRKVRVSEPCDDIQSQSGLGTEAILDDRSFQSGSFLNMLKNSISVADPRDTQSLAGHGAEIRLRDTSYTSSSPSTARFTPESLPASSEAKPAVQNLSEDNSFSRSYRVPDTLDL